MRTTATIPTMQGSRTLQQLCKHWSHKMPVDFSPERGVIAFPNKGGCTLEASNDGLNVTLDFESTEDLPRMQQIVFEHIKRFAFREELAEPIWRDA
mgnify:FL=1